MPTIAVRPKNKADYERFKQVIADGVQRNGAFKISGLGFDDLFVAVDISANAMDNFITRLLEGNAGRFPVANDEPRNAQEAIERMASEINCSIEWQWADQSWLCRSKNFGQKCSNPDCRGGIVRKRSVTSGSLLPDNGFDVNAVSVFKEITEPCPDCAGRGWRIV